MNQLALPHYYYPNKMGRIVLLGLEEVLGRTGINAVLNLARLPGYINCYPPNNLDRCFEFGDLGKLQGALESLYGPQGGRGVALRSGRSCFKYALREFGSLLGITDLAFRLLPSNEKMSRSVSIFADIFNDYSDQRVRIEETATHIFWYVERCPVCWGRHTDQPTCHLLVGILQEALYWVSGGKYFSVQETSCIAAGAAACTIEIDKQPIE
jgi:predicted hydrocarbon binding protein